MKSFIRALGNVFLTFLIMLLVVYGWAYIEMKILLKNQPELFGYAFYMQETDDMLPEFENNDVIIVKKDDEYKIGSIVLYFDGEDSKYKVHSIVAIDGDSVTTKCLPCTANNKPVSKDNIYGRAVGKVMVLGKIIRFFKQKAVLIGIAAIGFILLVISQILEFKKPKKKPIPIASDELSVRDDEQKNS